MRSFFFNSHWILHGLIVLQWIVLSLGGTADNCPPADPNCHPSCIVYDADHCRYCRCPRNDVHSGFSTGSGSSNGDWGGGSRSTDASWDNEFSNDGDWSSRVGGDNSWEHTSNDNSWSNSGGDSSWSNSDKGYRDSSSFHDNDKYGTSGTGHNTNSDSERIHYIIVEKDSQPSYGGPLFPGGGTLSDIGMSRSPFSGAGTMPASLSPGSNDIIDSQAYPGQVMHVPLVAPGQPRYCVRCPILSCPSTCERVDEWGCHSCPCAPSRFQTMPVARDCSNPDLHRRPPDCSATKLCIEFCRDNYKLGEVGSDGCRTCACFHSAPRTTPRPEAPSCPATLKCMLKCRDGYILGDKQRDGCPSCRCLPQGVSNHRNNSASSNSNNNKDNNNNNNNNNNKNSWTNAWNKDNNNGDRKKGCSRNNNYLSSTNGIGSGKCKPPMCLDGHMSVDEAMQMGRDSAMGGMSDTGEEDDCTEGVFDRGSIDGMGSNSGDGFSSTSGGFFGTGSMGSGLSGTKDIGSGMSGDCFPMCQNDKNNQFNSGGSAPTLSGSGGGCSGPFCATMSGAGTGGMMMGGSGGGGGGGMKGFSPFAAAMMAGGGPGVGMPMSPSSGGPSSSSTTSGGPTSGGPTSGGPTPGPRAVHKDCPDLVHCLVTCGDRYVLGDLDLNGCQTCSCS